MEVSSCKDTTCLLSDEAYSIYSPCMYKPSFEEYKEQIDCLISDPSVKIFVCELNSKKTGMMVLKFSDSGAEIIGIAVSEKLRRQGIGNHMIQYVMESEGLERLEAQTDDDSVGFYRKCGFTEERIVVDYPDGSVVRYNCVLSKKTNPYLSGYQ